MAKEIYIDGNGNENLVSGTINNAEILPITSGSATNTKDYIDSKTSFPNVTATLGTNITGNVYYKKVDNMVWVCGRITTTASIPVNTICFSGFPTNNFNGNNVFKAYDNDGVSADKVFYQPQSTGNVLCATAIDNGKTYIFSYIYYTAM